MSDLRLQEEQDRAYNEEQRLRRQAAAEAYAQNEAYSELADENAALRKRVAELEKRADYKAKCYGEELKAYANDRDAALKRVSELEGVLEPFAEFTRQTPSRKLTVGCTVVITRSGDAELTVADCEAALAASKRAGGEGSTMSDTKGLVERLGEHATYVEVSRRSLDVDEIEMVRDMREAAATIERLEKKLAKPDAYWSDVDEETSRLDPDEFRDFMECNGCAEPGVVFWCDPLVQLDREFYGVVPSSGPYMGEWTDGEYYGNTDLVGPFPTHEEAKEAADGVSKERYDEWRLRVEENA